MQTDKKTLLAYTILLAACVVWGSAFVPQKTAMEATGAFSYGGARLILGGLSLLLLNLFARKKFNREIFVHGTILGIFLFLGTSTQQIGMQYTSATNGGFITGLYLLFVPLIITFYQRQRLSYALWVGAVLCLGGLALLCLTEGVELNKGDVWILACALLFSLHILCIDKFVVKNDFLPLAITQFFVAGVLGTACALILEFESIPGIELAWKEILYGGLASIGFAHTAQMFSQKYIAAEKAALVCSLESVFAAITGWYFLSESLNNIQLFGCIMMFLGSALACFQGSKIQSS